MKRYLLLFVVTIALLATSCTTFSTSSWNSPFINSEDIVKLEFGMTKNDVLDAMPESLLYVESGNAETSVWVYNVRTIKVQSKKESDGSMKPQKTSKLKQHQSEIDNLYLTFDVQNRLLAWGANPYDPNYVAPYYDCDGKCNGDAYIDDCGNCNIPVAEEQEDKEEGSFKLQLNVEGTQEPDGTLIIEGGN